MRTVPFGKYKGRPVVELWRDVEYMDWLAKQPWFRKNFRHLLKRSAVIENDARPSGRMWWKDGAA